MNVERIEAIEARAKAAGPGPWMRNGKTAAGWRIDNADPNRVGIAFMLTPTAIVPSDADAEFIAEAREDVPALIAEILRLRREVAGHEAGAERVQACADSYQDTIAELQKANGVLRAEKADLSRLVDLAAAGADRDALEYAELRRVVAAAKEADRVRTAILERQRADGPQAAMIEYREAHAKAQQELASSLGALSPTAAKGLAMEKARAAVVNAARFHFDAAPGDYSLALAVDALKLLELQG